LQSLEYGGGCFGERTALAGPNHPADAGDQLGIIGKRKGNRRSAALTGIKGHFGPSPQMRGTLLINLKVGVHLSYQNSGEASPRETEFVGDLLEQLIPFFLRRIMEEIWKVNCRPGFRWQGG